MAKILKMPIDPAQRSATTAPQDVLREDAATFDVLRQMREDILCCVLKPDQRLRFGELRQRYDTSVGTLREALSHLVSEGLARTEAGRGFSVAPISLADFLDLSELRVYLETRTLADAMGLKGIKLIVPHDTADWNAKRDAEVFLDLARRTGGCVLPFDGNAPARLRELLAAVAVYAVGGMEMLEQKRDEMPGAVMLLEHLRR